MEPAPGVCLIDQRGVRLIEVSVMRELTVVPMETVNFVSREEKSSLFPEGSVIR